MKSENSNLVYEIALYSIKEEAKLNFNRLNNSAMKRIKSYNGFVECSNYHSIVNPLLYLDIVTWQSLENALEAQERAESDSEMRTFMESIEEVKYFDHVIAIPNKSWIQYQVKKSNDILELVMLNLKNESYDNFEKHRLPLMDHVSETFPSFRDILTVQSVKDPNVIIDIAHWENINACTLAQKEVESKRVFSDYVRNFDMNKGMIQEFFTPLN